jgi:hypothetical protein
MMLMSSAVFAGAEKERAFPSDLHDLIGERTEMVLREGYAFAEAHPPHVFGRNVRDARLVLRFCYKTGFTEMKIVQFYALLTRRKHSLDSIICSLRDSIQNSMNWLLTSGSMVRVHHGSFRRTIESIICERPAMVALLALTRFCYNSRRSSDARSP